MTTVEKRCCVCGEDVANKKRVKDPRGQYYCDPCYQQKRAAAPSATRTPVTAGGGPEDLPPSSAEPLLDLAPEVKPARQENMFGCASCKKLVPERQIKNLDGEFLCNACVAKRRAPAGRTAPDTSDASSAAVAGFGDSLVGGLLFTLGTIAAVFGLVFALQWVMPLPMPNPSSIRSLKDSVSGIGVGVIYTIWFLGFALVTWTGVIIALKTGRGNGASLGASLWKTFAVCAIITLFFRLTDQMFLGYIFGIVPWLFFVIRYTILDVSIAALFDFEGGPRRIVSLVGMLFSELMGFLFYILLTAFVIAGGIHTSGNFLDDVGGDEEDVPRMKHVAPAPGQDKLKDPDDNADKAPAGEKPAAEPAAPAAAPGE